jgi:ubiquinone/menaquinone biosynthesis C-methylase UbiE
MRATIKIRARKVADAYRPWLKPGAKVLDVGCGNGVMAEELRKAFRCDITGTDVLEYLAADIAFRKMAREDALPFSGKSFDVAMFIDALHHCDSYGTQERLLKEAGRVARRVLIFELKPTAVARLWDWLANKVHNPSMRIPFNFRTKDEWASLFARLGFTTECVETKASLAYPLTHYAFCLERR